MSFTCEFLEKTEMSLIPSVSPQGRGSLRSEWNRALWCVHVSFRREFAELMEKYGSNHITASGRISPTQLSTGKTHHHVRHEHSTQNRPNPQTALWRRQTRLYSNSSNALKFTACYKIALWSLSKTNSSFKRVHYKFNFSFPCLRVAELQTKQPH